MSVLLLGANGQLGRHLRGHIDDLVTVARDQADHVLDLADIDRTRRLLDELRPELIINAAAWTAVDAAEDHESDAWRLNHDLPAELADWCRSSGALLVHYSTDYVFSGDPGRPWREDDPVAPQSAYGRTKLAGEQAVIASACRALVLRTAWVYSALPGNFLSAILKRAGTGAALQVVGDQVGSPTWAGTLADATHTLIRTVAPGLEGPTLLHVAANGAMSWYQLAELAVRLAADRGIIPEAVPVEEINSDQWPQAAARPKWSVLDVSRYETMTGRPLPQPATALADCLDQWTRAIC